MRHAHLHLRVRGFFEEGEKRDEVLVLGHRLRQVRRPALFVIGIRDRKFRFGQVFAVGIGIDQGLQREPPFRVAAVLDVVDRAIVENLVGLGRCVVSLSAVLAGAFFFG